MIGSLSTTASLSKLSAGAASMDAMDVEVRPVDAGRWDDLVTLFGPRGACAGCWCMWWRLSNKEMHVNGNEGNRAALESLVRAGDPVGLLGYADGEPVGWCGVAPRPAYHRLRRSRVLALTGLDDPSVWSVVCFFVARRRRRAGVAGALLEGAVEHAVAGGARVVEGYPVTSAAGKSAASLYTGTVELFTQAGFTPHADSSGSRVVMRRAVHRPA